MDSAGDARPRGRPAPSAGGDGGGAGGERLPGGFGPGGPAGLRRAQLNADRI